MEIMESLAVHETTLRLSAFMGVFMIMALWERLAPRRFLNAPRDKRWLTNLTLMVLNTLLLRLLLPGGAVAAAVAAENAGWGLLANLTVPTWGGIVITLLVLDFLIYLQHRLFHVVPLLWRLHQVHHADPDIDVTTGARFHSLEILLSMLIKMTVVVALGAPPLAVILFEIILNATAMFNHANAYLPPRLDGWLRWLVVTPDMHRVHHSPWSREINSNFGFNVPWWDRLLGTYCPQPRMGHQGMRIGLDYISERQGFSLPRLLLMPFQVKRGGKS